MALLAVIGPYVYEVAIPDNVTAAQALVQLTTPGPHNPSAFSGEWLDTKDGYKIRRDAINAFAGGEPANDAVRAPSLKR
jgi:hypothetical protein